MYDRSTVNTIEYHRSMLVDSRRLQSFERAITELVEPGDVVVDLGCGTGILSFFACRAGAKHVYAIEMSGIIEAAKALSRANGFESRVTFLNDLSTQVDLPQKADVLVTETIGNFGLEEGILGWVADARRRFLKPGARIIPHSLELFISPIEVPKLYQKIEEWGVELHGMDFSTMRRQLANNIFSTQLSPESFLSQPSILDQINLTETESDGVEGKVSFSIDKPGVMHGIGGWFSAALSDTISISNAPPTNAPSWKNVYLPLEQPLSVSQDDRLEVHVQSIANGSLWNWQIDHQAGRKKEAQSEGMVRSKQSTFFGQFISPSVLHKQAPAHRPQRNPDGEIAFFVLSVMNGSASLQEISNQLLQRFPGRFTSGEQALSFVRNLSRRYSR